VSAENSEAARSSRRARTPRVRSHRSLTESLLSIVLGLEAVLVFFIALTVFGLHSLSPALAFGGGAALVVLLAVATRVVRYQWGVWLGWVLQAALIATGIVLPVLYVVAAVFVAIWVYCVVRARQVDRRNATLAAQEPTTEPSSQNGS
jgi:Protein of unknown function (DUF4233)